MNILLTGGAGYIGSHTALALLESGHVISILDNLCNSNLSVIFDIENIAQKKIKYIDGDVRNVGLLSKLLEADKIDAVIHFAGLKSVRESFEKPLKYYENNVQGAISLLEAMENTGIKKLVFSSSATVYGNPQYLPIDENHPTNPTNPYGRTKLQIEEMLRDLSMSDPTWSFLCLRYFNPVGAHDSGIIGESPIETPNNLMPYIAQLAVGKQNLLKIFGSDYPTVDGTGVRDYIHIMDLADGHNVAINYINGKSGFDIINLGTGIGYSVLELVKAFETVTQSKLKYKKTSIRDGDVAICYANAHKAYELMSWKAKRTLSEMCKSAWEYEIRKIAK